jgi:hypothetical protein
MIFSFNKTKKILLFAFLLAFFYIPQTPISADTGIPNIISYQGHLTDTGGNPLGGTGTPYYFKFSFWDGSTVGAGNKVWPSSSPNSTSLTVKQGSFNVNIGDTTSGYPDTLDYNWNSNQKVYLQIEISSDNITFETLSPRSLITSAPTSQVASQVNGVNSSSFGTTTPFLNTLISALSTNINSAVMTIKGIAGQIANLFNVFDSSGNTLFTVAPSGNVGVGTSVPGGLLHVEGDGTPNLQAIFVNSLTPSATSGSGLVAYMKDFPTASDQRLGYLAFGSRGGAENQYHGALIGAFSEGSWTSSSRPTYIVFQTTPNGASSRAEIMRITASGSVGIGTTTPSAKLAVTGTAGTLDLFNFASSTNASMLALGSTGQLRWGSGLGAISQIFGPVDQAFKISAGTPLQIASSVVGNGLTLNAGNAVAGASVNGSASGGNVSIIGGNGANLNTVGVGNGGSVSITAGNSGSAGSGSNGGEVSIISGNALASGVAGAIKLTTGYSTNASQGGAINLLTSPGGDISLTTGNSIGSPGAIVLTAGSQNVSGTGVAVGGALSFNAGTGQSNLSASGSGAAGGAITITGGRGGNQTGNTSSAGGTGGIYTVIGGSGGAATGAGGTHLGGTGSTLSFTSGAGGSATGASGTRTGGNSGNIVFNVGAVGTGATANGTLGNFQFLTGNVGIGTTTPGQQLEITGNFKLPNSTASTGIIYSGSNRFIHNFGGVTNFFAGVDAGNLTMTGTDNSGIGYQTLDALTSGSDNTAFGTQSLSGLTTGVRNVTVGYRAGQSLNTSNNVAVGWGALNSSTVAGSSNIAMGWSAMSNGTNAVGSRNIGIGENALDAVTGSNNIGLGPYAGLNLTSGGNNIFLGYNAGDNMTSGSNNILLGYDIDAPSATSSNQLSIGNLIFGTGINGTGSTISTGNVGIGTISPAVKLTIQNGANVYAQPNIANTFDFALGIAATTDLISGMDFKNFSTAGQVRLMARDDRDDYVVMNTFGSTAGGTIFGVNRTNTHAIFGQGTTDTSKKLSIGTFNAGDLILGTNNTERIRILSTGNLGIGTTTPTAQLHTTGTIRFSSLGAGSLQTDADGNLTVSSDEKLKNIQGDFTRGLTDLLKINPISYKWNTLSGYDTDSMYSGFSAQNIQLAIPEAVATSSNGFLTLSDRPIIATLVNAVKEVGIKIEKIMIWFGGDGSKFNISGDVCVDEVCISKDQFKVMLQNSGAITNIPAIEDSEIVDEQIPLVSTSTDTASSTVVDVEEDMLYNIISSTSSVSETPPIADPIVQSSTSENTESLSITTTQ